jgi:hypothetical protein
VLQIVAPEDLARILQDRLQRVKDDLIATAKAEKQARDDSEAMVRSLVAKTRFEEEDRRRILLADYEQRKVTSRLSSISQEIERLVEERELNRLGDQQELERERDLRDASKDLSDRDSPLVSQELDEARKSPELDERTKARLAKVPDDQQRLQDAIENLAKRIEKWADFADIINEVRTIIGDQERVTSSTEDVLKQNKGEAPK